METYLSVTDNWFTAPLLHSVLEEIQELLGVLAVPAFVTPMGKGTVDEQHPRFGGLYAGAGSRPEVREFVESASCVIWIGNYAADLNSYWLSPPLNH